jgi:hypothetical protein
MACPSDEVTKSIKPSAAVGFAASFRVTMGYLATTLDCAGTGITARPGAADTSDTYTNPASTSPKETFWSTLRTFGSRDTIFSVTPDNHSGPKPGSLARLAMASLV